MPAIGALDPSDVAAYQVFEREPLRVDLPRATLLTNPAPSLGGAIIAQALTDLAEIEEPTALDLLTALRDATDHNKSLAPVSVRGTTHASVTDGRQTVSPSPQLMKLLPPRWREVMSSTVARKP